MADVKTPRGAIDMIMSCFDNRKDVFLFGGKEVPFKAEDVAILFGLPMGGMEVNLHLGTVKENANSTTFYKRNFNSKKSWVTKEEIKTSMHVCIGRKDEHLVDDLCTMLIMYMFCTFINPGSSNKFRLSTLLHLNDTMASISWAKVIHTRLMKEMKKWSPTNQYKMYTCTIILMYFLLEHVQLIGKRPKHDKSLPRAARWSFKGLNIPGNLKTKKSLKVETDISEMADIQNCILEEPIIEEDSQSTLKEKLRNALEENTNLQTKIKDLESKNKLLEEQHTKVCKELDRLQSLVSENVDKNETTINEDTTKEAGNIAEEDQHLNPIIKEGSGNIANQSETVGLSQGVESCWEAEKHRGNVSFETPSFDLGISPDEDDLIYASKNSMEKETQFYNGGGCIENQAERVVPSEEEEGWRTEPRPNISFQTPTFDLGLSPNEDDITSDSQKTENFTPPSLKLLSQPNVEQSTPRPKPQTTSLVRHVRNRHINRKTTKQPDFDYHNKSKNMDGRSNAPIQLSDSPNVITPPEYKKPLPKIDKQECYRYLYSYAVTKVEAFFENASTSTKAYYNPETQVQVLGQDMANLVTNKFIGPNIIEWFGEYTMTRSNNVANLYIFHPTLWSYIENNKVVELNLIKPLEMIKDIRKFDFLVFPMNSSRTNDTNDRAGHHWTLLVLDCKRLEWKHYNSQNGRKYFKDASTFKNKIAETIKKTRKMTKAEISRIDAEVDSPKCSQQGGTVDCATFVCKFISTIAKGCSPENIIIDTFSIQVQKAHICYNVLNSNYS